MTLLNHPTALFLVGALACGCTPADPGKDEPNDDTSSDSSVDSDSSNDSDSSDDSDSDSSGETDTGEPLGTPVGSLSARLHETIPSMFYVTWTQLEATDSVRVEYSIDTDIWLSTPDKPGSLGEHQQLVVGAPYATAVQWRVTAVRGEESKTEDGDPITTGDAPPDLPEITIDIADSAAWDPAGRFLLTSVSEEDPLRSTRPTFWVVVVDRVGRYVWATPADPGSWTLFAKPSRDGSTILWDDSLFWTDFSGDDEGKVHQMTLDGAIVHEWQTPGLSHAFDDLSDDTIAWTQTTDGDELLMLSTGDAAPEQIWDCVEWVRTSDIAREPDRPNAETCGTNSLFWNEPTGTYLMSLWSHETVLEWDPVSDEVLWYSDPNRAHGYDVAPTTATWHWEHDAQLLDDGHLMLSSGVEADPPNRDGSFAATASYEFDVDRSSGALNLVWSYLSEPEWASRYKGGLRRLTNGDTLHYYGDMGGAKEITPAGDVVWQIRFERPSDSWIGRSTLLEDLYAFVP